MHRHPEILVNIFIDGATYSGAPAKVARNVTAIADTGAQTNVWSLDAFLQCGFDRNILIPSADLVAANHTVVSIAGAFHAIIEGTTSDRSTIQCRAMIYVSTGIHALYLSQHFLFGCIFILLSRESDQCAIRARLGVAGHLSTTPRWGNPVKCLSQRHNK